MMFSSYMVTVFIEHVSMLTFANQRFTQRKTEADGNVTFWSHKQKFWTNEQYLDLMMLPEWINKHKSLYLMS